MRRWDNVYNGLNGSCGKGEPLSEYEREEVASVLGVQIAGGYSKIQVRNYFVDFLGISTAAECDSLCQSLPKKKKHPRVQQDGIVHRPDVLKYKLHEQRLQ
jgi:hypothetical protein